MKNIHGLDMPQTLEEICTPARLALVVYDMQIGILSQLIAQGIDGRLSISHGDGLATGRRSGQGQPMVFARLKGDKVARDDLVPPFLGT